MITAGDEFGRTQRGNNNAYCQDNELSWVLWDRIDEAGHNLLGFVRELLALRNNHIVFRRSRFFHGEVIPGTDDRDVTWLAPDGTTLQEEAWQNPDLRTLGIMLSGQAGERFLTDRGEPEPDDTFLILLNAGTKRVTWTLPETDQRNPWRLRLSSAYATGLPSSRRSATSRVMVGARTALVLVQYHSRNPDKRFRP
jgi:glycogen operon protein